MVVLSPMSSKLKVKDHTGDYFSGDEYNAIKVNFDKLVGYFFVTNVYALASSNE